MLELLAPAGSPEAVVAAVQNGADAVYMGFSAFNTDADAPNFTEDEFAESLRYCRVRGCRVYVTLNTLVGDADLLRVSGLARRAYELGADAALVRDFGLAKILRSVTPDLPVYGDFGLGIHNLDGVLAAHDLGFVRVALSPLLNLDQIRHICARSPIEIELLALGRQCPGHPGQCYMSAFTRQKSANLGSCQNLCREDYSTENRMDSYPLCLQDVNLISRLKEIGDCGVSCIRLTGRSRAPEYTALATSLFGRAIRESVAPQTEDLISLDEAFVNTGFTQGSFAAEDYESMRCTPSEPHREAARIRAGIRKSYSGVETRRVKVWFLAAVEKGRKSRFAALDERGSRVTVEGPVPSAAMGQGLDDRHVEEQLYKTGGTPYLCAGVRTKVDPGLFLPTDSLADARKRLLTKLTEAREIPPRVRVGPMPLSPSRGRKLERPAMVFQVFDEEQLVPELAELAPERLYVPLHILAAHFEKTAPFLDAGAGITAVLPPVITEEEMDNVSCQLQKIARFGVTEVLVSSLGHIRLARRLGFGIRGDYGLNVYNAYTLEILEKAGFLSATASVELGLGKVREMIKPLDTEMIVYGRLPLMLTQYPVAVSGAGNLGRRNTDRLKSRQGELFPVVDLPAGRAILSPDKLFLAPRRKELEKSGLWAQRLWFTTESPRECVLVARRFVGQSDYRPNGLIPDFWS